MRVTIHTNGCWEWLGTKTEDGYGRLSSHIDGQQATLAHRFSYILFYGSKIPVGYHIAHTCDNPSCINPSHLFLARPIDNKIDASIKRRLGRSDFKLTKQQVLDMHADYNNGLGYKLLAKKYNISRESVRSVIAKKTYAWAFDTAFPETLWDC